MAQIAKQVDVPDPSTPTDSSRVAMHDLIAFSCDVAYGWCCETPSHPIGLSEAETLQYAQAVAEMYSLAERTNRSPKW